MVTLLKEVRQKVVIGFVGGSDLSKITEQLEVHGQSGMLVDTPNTFLRHKANKGSIESSMTLTIASLKTA